MWTFIVVLWICGILAVVFGGMGIHHDFYSFGGASSNLITSIVFTSLTTVGVGAFCFLSHRWMDKEYAVLTKHDEGGDVKGETGEDFKPPEKQDDEVDGKNQLHQPGNLKVPAVPPDQSPDSPATLAAGEEGDPAKRPPGKPAVPAEPS